MKNIDISRFSSRYSVRRLCEADMEDILWLMRDQELYYKYSGNECSPEQVRRDMATLPPGKGAEDKYYLGYYDGDYLAAVLDFIDGYPDADTAYIGFFMLPEYGQRKGRGTVLMEMLCTYCTELGYRRVMLGWDKHNPQSTRFWRKMGFQPLREEGGIVVAERILPAPQPKPIFGDFLLQQAQAHPTMEARDALKMCYQAARGAEHGISDPAAARKWLREELKSLPSDEREPLYEQISPEMCRVNLRAWKARELPWRWLYNMFTSSGGSGEIEPLLQTVAKLAGEGALPFTAGDWQLELEGWDGGAVSHSEGYRAAEKPAYRIVPMSFAAAFPVMEKMARHPEMCVVAIDGRSNSGKSTLAEALVKATEGGLVRMDDLLSPASRMQVVHLGYPGGNVHYGFFQEDILPKLRSEKAFSHRYFAEHSLVISGKRRVRRSKVRIVEGSYSQHVVFGDYADVRVYMTTTVDEQRRRVIARDGEELAASYFHIWIPQEEEYFRFFHLWEKADVVIET